VEEDESSEKKIFKNLFGMNKALDKKVKNDHAIFNYFG
jgi:hypothetical protein